MTTFEAMCSIRDDFVERLVRAGQEPLAKEIDGWLLEHWTHDGLTLEHVPWEYATTRGTCGCGANQEFRYAL